MAEGPDTISVSNVAMTLIDGFVIDHTQLPIRVIFVGEGNFTYSTAFAALRGGWKNIIASEKGDVTPDYWNTVVLTIRNCLQYNGLLPVPNQELPVDHHDLLNTLQYID